MSDSPGNPGPAADIDPLTVFDPARREADLRDMTRIVLQPIGSPLPLGFFTIGRLAMAHHATRGSLAMQLRDIERQAGARRTL